MFIFDVGIECGVAEISFSADADIISFHGVISGSSFSSGDELFLAFERALFLVAHVHCFLYKSKLWS